VSEGFCSGACPARARRRPRFARDPAGLIPGPGRKGQQRPPAGFDRVTRTQQPRGLAALDKRHLELVQRYREPFATRLDVSFFQSPAAKEGGYAPAPRHVACHVVRCNANCSRNPCSSNPPSCAAAAARTTVRNESTTTTPGLTRATSATMAFNTVARPFSRIV
jgi:hypothetical protein